MKQKKSDIAELQRIQSLIPNELKSRITRKEKMTPVLSRIAREAVELKSDDDPNKERIQNLIDSGLLDQKEEVENKSTVKKLNKFLEQEIAKSVLAGRLSKPKDEKILNKYKKICRKLSRTNT